MMDTTVNQKGQVIICQYSKQNFRTYWGYSGDVDYIKNITNMLEYNNCSEVGCLTVKNEWRKIKIVWYGIDDDYTTN